MEGKNSEENGVKVIYGKQNLKDIVTEMLEVIFIEKIEKSENE